MKCILATSLSLCLLPLSSASAGDIHERTSFFLIRGSTFDQLDRPIGMKGPHLGSSGRRAGITNVAFEDDATFKEIPGGCRIDRAGVKLKLHTTLPQWSSPHEATSQTKALWKKHRDKVAAHEAEHSRIAKHWLKRIEARIRSLPAEADCASMERRVASEMRSLRKQHDADQLAFDAAESRRIRVDQWNKLAQSSENTAIR